MQWQAAVKIDDHDDDGDDQFSDPLQCGPDVPLGTKRVASARDGGQSKVGARDLRPHGSAGRLKCDVASLRFAG
jgi:hypothetical protein